MSAFEKIYHRGKRTQRDLINKLIIKNAQFLLTFCFKVEIYSEIILFHLKKVIHKLEKLSSYPN